MTMKNQNHHLIHLVSKNWIPILVGVGILLHISFYLIYAFELELNKNMEDEALKLFTKILNVFYAFGFHMFVLVAVIVFYFKIKNSIIKAMSFFTIIFEIVCLGSFIIMGIIYDKPYFYIKAAFLISIISFVAYHLLRKIIKYVRNYFIQFQ